VAGAHGLHATQSRFLPQCGLCTRARVLGLVDPLCCAGSASTISRVPNQLREFAESLACLQCAELLNLAARAASGFQVFPGTNGVLVPQWALGDGTCHCPALSGCPALPQPPQGFEIGSACRASVFACVFALKGFERIRKDAGTPISFEATWAAFATLSVPKP
jgi:hypothetical protein